MKDWIKMNEIITLDFIAQSVSHKFDSRSGAKLKIKKKKQCLKVCQVRISKPVYTSTNWTWTIWIMQKL